MTAVHRMCLGFTLFLLAGCAPTDSDLRLSGTIECDDLDLVAPVTARLMQVRFAEGADVTPGDTVAILDTTAAAANVRAASAVVSQARAALADLQAGSDQEKIRAAQSRLQQSQNTLEQAKRDLQRAQKLHDQKLLDDRSLEQARLTVDNAEAAVRITTEEYNDLKRGARVDQIDAAQSALNRAQAELTAQQQRLQDHFLISHHSGIVQLLPFQVGEYVPAGRPAVTLINLDSLWALVYIPEDKVNAASIGASVTFSVDAYPDREFNSQVTFIASEAEFTPRNVQSKDERLNLVFAVKLIISNPDHQLRPGIPADFFFGKN